MRAPSRWFWSIPTGPGWPRSRAELAGAARILREDLTDRSDLDRVAEQVEAMPGLDLLVDTAGIIRPGTVAELLPHLEKQGEKGLQRFLASRGPTPS